MPKVGPLKLKLQVIRGDEAAIGPGKADLLEAIARAGSISAAGRAMGMSYRRAWVLVSTMNHCWRSPLVETDPGSGARVTPTGQRVLAAYRALEADLARAAKSTALAELECLLEREFGRSC